MLRNVRAIVETNGVKKSEKSYNLVIKVLPTGDLNRYSKRQTFIEMLKFSKEVQVYCEIADPVNK